MSIAVSLVSRHFKEALGTLESLVFYAKAKEAFTITLVIQDKRKKQEPTNDEVELLSKQFSISEPLPAPRNITFGDLTLNEYELHSTLKLYFAPSGNNISQIRSIIIKHLIPQESFLFQIGSSMRFRDSWDELLLQELHTLEKDHKKCALTYNPVEYTSNLNTTSFPSEIRPVIQVPDKFNLEGVLTGVSRVINASNLPVDQRYVGPICITNIFTRSAHLRDIDFAALEDFPEGEELYWSYQFYLHNIITCVLSRTVLYRKAEEYRETASSAREESLLLLQQLLLNTEETSKKGRDFWDELQCNPETKEVKSKKYECIDMNHEKNQLLFMLNKLKEVL